MTTTTTIEHRVRDFAAWRTAYNQHRATRDAAGAANDRVYRAVDDPNNVCVVMDFPSEEKADRFFTSDDLRQAMEEAGVDGAPRITVGARVVAPTL